MKTYYPKGLVKRFLALVLGLFLVGFLLIYLISTYLFEISNEQILGIFIGFIICTSVLGFSYLKTLKHLGRAFYKTQAIARGNMDLRYDDLYSKDISEFYNFHKNLNQIWDERIYQKRIINQEAAELEAVISAVRGAIVAVDTNQKVLFFNKEATFLFQQKKSKYRTEIFLSELVRNPEILDCYKNCLETGDICTKKTEINLFDSEEDIVYELSVAPLKDDKDIKGAVGLFYDITNVKKTERLHIDFISNVSHELRTPLTAIQGYVQTLSSEIPETFTTARRFIDIIERNVKRLVALLNHFLELAQFESVPFLKKEMISTEKITNSIIQDLYIQDHKLVCDFSVKEVFADKHFLKQVLYNLLDNAVRYVPKGKLIEILWTKKKEFVVLTVKDHGKGIHRKHKERIFERFYRVDRARTKDSGTVSGTVSGIGLFIVKELIEKHGGTISLASKEDEGSEFTCTFPI